MTTISTRSFPRRSNEYRAFRPVGRQPLYVPKSSSIFPKILGLVYCSFGASFPPRSGDTTLGFHGSGWEPALICMLSVIAFLLSRSVFCIQTDLRHCKTLAFELQLEHRTTPISSRPCRTKPTLANGVNATTDTCHGAGLIQHPSSPWALPVAVSGRPQEGW